MLNIRAKVPQFPTAAALQASLTSGQSSVASTPAAKSSLTDTATPNSHQCPPVPPGPTEGRQLSGVDSREGRSPNRHKKISPPRALSSPGHSSHSRRGQQQQQQAVGIDMSVVSGSPSTAVGKSSSRVSSATHSDQQPRSLGAYRRSEGHKSPSSSGSAGSHSTSHSSHKSSHSSHRSDRTHSQSHHHKHPVSTNHNALSPLKLSVGHQANIANQESIDKQQQDMSNSSIVTPPNVVIGASGDAPNRGASNFSSPKDKV